MPIKGVFDMNGQTAIVTGAGSGVAQHIALTLAQAGAEVVVSDLLLHEAEGVARKIEAAGGSAIAVACDATKEHDLEQLCKDAISHYGKITVLVNYPNSVSPDRTSVAMSHFEHTYRRRVLSAFTMSKLCAPHMAMAGGGAILNVSSTSAKNDAPMSAHFSSRAAINHLTQDITTELQDDKIRVNGIVPGTGCLDTGACLRIDASQIASNEATRRTCKPDDVGLAALYLCSSTSTWISGQVLSIKRDCEKEFAWIDLSPASLSH